MLRRRRVGRGLPVGGSLGFRRLVEAGLACFGGLAPRKSTGSAQRDGRERQESKDAFGFSILIFHAFIRKQHVCQRWKLSRLSKSRPVAFALSRRSQGLYWLIAVGAAFHSAAEDGRYRKARLQPALRAPMEGVGGGNQGDAPFRCGKSAHGGIELTVLERVSIGGLLPGDGLW